MGKPQANENIIEIQKLECCRCGHTWAPRVVDIRTCPNCRSPYWNKPKIEMKDVPS